MRSKPVSKPTRKCGCFPHGTQRRYAFCLGSVGKWHHRVPVHAGVDFGNDLHGCCFRIPESNVFTRSDRYALGCQKPSVGLLSSTVVRHQVTSQPELSWAENRRRPTFFHRETRMAWFRKEDPARWSILFQRWKSFTSQANLLSAAIGLSASIPKDSNPVAVLETESQPREVQIVKEIPAGSKIVVHESGEDSVTYEIPRIGFTERAKSSAIFMTSWLGGFLLFLGLSIGAGSWAYTLFAVPFVFCRNQILLSKRLAGISSRRYSGDLGWWWWSIRKQTPR